MVSRRQRPRTFREPFPYSAEELDQLAKEARGDFSGDAGRELTDWELKRTPEERIKFAYFCLRHNPEILPE